MKTLAKPKVLSMLMSLVAVIAVGCSDSDSLEVTGKVTFDGQPVSEGDIIYRTPERAFGGKIKNGIYSLNVTPGPSRVEITAFRPIPGKVDRSNPGEERPLLAPYIPPKYNAESTLSATVSGAQTQFDFQLEPDSRRRGRR